MTFGKGNRKICQLCHYSVNKARTKGGTKIGIIPVNKDIFCLLQMRVWLVMTSGYYKAFCKSSLTRSRETCFSDKGRDRRHMWRPPKRYIFRTKRNARKKRPFFEAKRCYNPHLLKFKAPRFQFLPHCDRHTCGFCL